MTNTNRPTDKLEWHYIRWGGIIAVRTIRVWAKIHRKTSYVIELERPISTEEITILAANHQTLLDPPAIFGALTFNDLLKISPVKFMTWHKYYNSIYKLPLYTTGCYPSHGPGHTGVSGAVHYAQNGYRVFIFPEGKRTNSNTRGKVYEGISRVLETLPDARLLLVRLEWEKRTSFLSRPSLLVHIFDAPSALDRNDPKSIMDAVYNANK